LIFSIRQHPIPALFLSLPYLRARLDGVGFGLELAFLDRARPPDPALPRTSVREPNRAGAAAMAI